MKKTLVSALAACGLSAGSALAAPIDLPGGPLFVQFQNFEQINPAALPGTENSWGIIQVRQISTGTVIIPNSTIAGDDAFFDGTNPGGPQITGIFYGLNATTCTSSPLCSSGGRLDLYWDEAGLIGGGTMVNWDSSVLTPALRTSASTYTGITDGTLLASLEFASGADAANANVTLTGSVPVSSGTAEFTGSAAGYFNVDLTAGGAWAEKLDGDWFNTIFGTRDLRFRNVYTGPLATWSNQGGVGAFSTDPVMAFAIPEPGSLALLGIALLGFAGLRRRLAS